MGYCYDRHNRLCCDYCGKSGGVRKFRCPFGYCPSVAACPDCRKNRAEEFTKEFHRKLGCEARHNAFMAERQREAELLASGVPVRCSALSTDDGRVHVLFRTMAGTIGHYMSHDTYHAIPSGTIATPDDYRQHGTLDEAPGEYVWGGTTKQMVTR